MPDPVSFPLEIKTVGNFKVRLNFKDPVAMMLFAELKDPVRQKIQSQYGGGQSKATPSDELWVQHLRTNQLEVIGLLNFCSIAQIRKYHLKAEDESMNRGRAMRSCCVSRGCFNR